MCATLCKYTSAVAMTALCVTFCDTFLSPPLPVQWSTQTSKVYEPISVLEISLEVFTTSVEYTFTWLRYGGKATSRLMRQSQTIKYFPNFHGVKQDAAWKPNPMSCLGVPTSEDYYIISLSVLLELKLSMREAECWVHRGVFLAVLPVHTTQSSFLNRRE